MECPWVTIAIPIKQLAVTELKKLKNQYKHYKEVKSRQITDMQGVLEVFGLLAGDQCNGVTEGREDGQRDSATMPMDVKFEEERYEDEDWYLLLLSELIFDKLKLEKPEIRLEYVPIVEEGGQSPDEQAASEISESDLKHLLSKDSPSDNRFPLID